MSAPRVVQIDEVGSDEILDADISAAIVCWMETELLPDRIDAEQWEDWLHGGCKGSLEAHEALITLSVLGHWARSWSSG